MSEWNQDRILGPVFAILVACGGGVCDYLLSDKHTVKEMVISLFLAGFCGFLMYFLIKDIEHVSDSFSHVLCGISGLSARSILKTLKKIGDSKFYGFLKGVK